MSAEQDYDAGTLAAARLWRMLSDIDLYDEACGRDNAAFRARVRGLLPARFVVASADEHRIYWKHLGEEKPAPVATEVDTSVVVVADPSTYMTFEELVAHRLREMDRK